MYLSNELCSLWGKNYTPFQRFLLESQSSSFTTQAYSFSLLSKLAAVRNSGTKACSNPWGLFLLWSYSLYEVTNDQAIQIDCKALWTQISLFLFLLKVLHHILLFHKWTALLAFWKIWTYCSDILLNGYIKNYLKIHVVWFRQQLTTMDALFSFP